MVIFLHPLLMDSSRGLEIGVGETVVKGVDEGRQPYVASFPVTHVDDLVDQLRAYADIGTIEFVFNLASYNYGEFDNQQMMLDQLELLGEHVLPKVPRG